MTIFLVSVGLAVIGIECLNLAIKDLRRAYAALTEATRLYKTALEIFAQAQVVRAEVLEVLGDRTKP